ncbi:MAG: O-antigen ligase family protein, partial [Planctomycetes bacterium]|nr:O-antigen ligase family protein [Planctomycetota bacterium]
FCLTRITTNRRNFTIVLWALVLGSLYIGYDAYTAPRGAFARGRLEVVGGPDFRHSSGLSSHMAAMLPLIAVAVITSRMWLTRATALVSGALTINTVILCRTRSAFVGLFVGLIAALLFAPRGRRILVYSLIGLALAGGYTLTDPPFWERMATLTDREGLAEDPAATGRTDVWRGARELIIQYPLGIGIGNFTQVIGTVDRELRLRAAHNTLVLCWTELGTQGIVVLVSMIFVSFLQVIYCFRRARFTDDPVWFRFMAYGLLLSMIVSLGAQMFTERLYTEAFWWILALPGCLQRVVIREVEQRSVQLESARLVDVGGWLEAIPILSHRTTRGALT